MRTAASVLALVLGAVWLSAGDGGVPVLPGDPLPGIGAADLERFRLGLDDFTEVETAEDGLGPAFNGNSCASCHSVPAIGGVSAMTEVRGGYRDEDGKFTALYGGTLYHLFSVPPHGCQVNIPAEANVIARRAPTPLFGAGLVEAIPDAAILALEDPGDANGDGIRGRAARVTDVATGQPRIGRFGWKAQHATLLAFSADAYRNEMGITNDLFPDEVALGIDPEQLRLCSQTRGLEDVRDRRLGTRAIDRFEHFMKFLAPLGRGPVDDVVRTGETVFSGIGCAACHVPSMTTGGNPNPLFDRRRVDLYSDLLLHDIGTGDGIEQDGARGEEIRTPALWGLRFRRPLMHDGSAANAEDAIRRHSGEGEGARKAFEHLSAGERAALLRFLSSL